MLRQFCLAVFFLGLCCLAKSKYVYAKTAVLEGERRVGATAFDGRGRFDVHLVAAAVSLAKQAKKDKTSTATEKSIFSRVDAKGKKHLTYYGLMVAGAMARTAAAGRVKTELESRVTCCFAGHSECHSESTSADRGRRRCFYSTWMLLRLGRSAGNQPGPVTLSRRCGRPARAT